MYDKDLAREILNQIHHAVEIILERFEAIKGLSDFTDSPEGIEKLDSICMQLIVIGESLKNYDKVTRNLVLSKYQQIEWKKVMGMRDIITHHYIDINAEAIYEVCKNKVPELLKIIELILKKEH